MLKPIALQLLTTPNSGARYSLIIFLFSSVVVVFFQFFLECDSQGQDHLLFLRDLKYAFYVQLSPAHLYHSHPQRIYLSICIKLYLLFFHA